MSLVPTYTGFDFLKYTAGNSLSGVGIGPTSSGTGVISQGLLNVQAVYTLTSAQLLALQSTAVQIAIAPGVGYALVPTSVSAQYKFVTTAYTIANADNSIQIEYTGKTTAFIGVPATGLVDQTVSEIRTVWPAVAGVDIAQTNEANLGLEVKLTGTTPALTLGDGTLTLTLRYLVLVLQ